MWKLCSRLLAVFETNGLGVMRAIFWCVVIALSVALVAAEMTGHGYMGMKTPQIAAPWR